MEFEYQDDKFRELMLYIGEFKRSMQRQQDCSSLLLSASDGSVAASC